MKKIIICLIFFAVFAGCLSSCAPSPLFMDEVSDVVIDEPVDIVDDEETEIAINIPAAPEETERSTEEKILDAPKSEPEKIKTVKYMRSETNVLNVRSGAGTKYTVLGTLDKGDLIKYVGELDGWVETRYKNKTAYVNKKYLSEVTFLAADEDTEKVIDIGCGLLGTKYVYGATRLHDGKGHFLSGFTTTAFDCSSLMQYIFFYGKGVLLDVNTRTQVKQGEDVSYKDLKRGDLMFFTNASRKDRTGIERIGHVALYLGDGYILHTASDHAVIEPLSPLRISYFICGRRI